MCFNIDLKNREKNIFSTLELACLCVYVCVCVCVHVCACKTEKVFSTQVCVGECERECDRVPIYNAVQNSTLHPT